jgi:hypothetical protein
LDFKNTEKILKALNSNNFSFKLKNYLLQI